MEELAYGGVNPFWVLLSGLSLWRQPESVLLLVDACWSCERSLRTRGAAAWRPLRSLACSQRPPVEGRAGAPGARLRARERKQRVGREKGEERARVDGDGGGVLIDGSLI